MYGITVVRLMSAQPEREEPPAPWMVTHTWMGNASRWQSGLAVWLATRLALNTGLPVH